jgi:non-specific serine/threonine protein kinase
VCRLEGEDPWDVAGTLVSLVDHSLVVRDLVDGTSRFRMLSPIAEYAARRLAAVDEQAQVALAHAGYHLRLISTDSSDWRQVEPEHLECITREYENVEAALGFAERAAIVPLALGFDVALLLFWRIRGLLRSGIHHLEAAAALVGEEATRERGFVLAGLAHFGQLLGDLDVAEARAVRAEAVFAALGDLVGARTVMGFRGDIALDRGDVAGARGHYARARALADAESDALDLGFWHANMGRAAARAGEVAVAEDELEQALVHLATAPGWYRGHVLVQLAALARLRGDQARAQGQLSEAMGHLQRYRATLEVIACLSELGRLALAGRDLERAATMLAAATALRDGAGLRPSDEDLAVLRDEIDALRAALDPDTFDRAWRAGTVMTLAAAVAFAAAPGPASWGYALAPPFVPAAATVGSQRADRAGVRGPDLTPREEQIAGHVARGLTNRQIAGALGIAPGTVRIHVERILGKLGMTSRVQVATWVTRRQRPGQ